MRKKDLEFVNTEAELKAEIDNSIFSKDFLFSEENHTPLDLSEKFKSKYDSLAL